jgi:predicted nucleotidyltransferase
MFTAAERDAVRTWLVAEAQTDERIVAAAITGSFAADTQDEWSNIDIFFGVADGTDRAAVVGTPSTPTSCAARWPRRPRRS